MTMSYDLAGRKTGMSDPDMGNWSYAYDALGNLKTQTDAKNQRTCLYYDLLNRLTGKNYLTSGSTCPDDAPTAYTTQYFYDNYTGLTYTPVTNNPIGRRTGMKDVSGSTAWEYDLRGRVVKEAKTVKDGTTTINTYTTAWSYNSADQAVSMTYPTGEVVTYGYLAQGQVKSLVSTTYNQPYLSNLSVDEAGRSRTLNLGNDTQTNYAYYPWATQGGAPEQHPIGDNGQLHLVAEPVLCL